MEEAKKEDEREGLTVNVGDGAEGAEEGRDAGSRESEGDGCTREGGDGGDGGEITEGGEGGDGGDGGESGEGGGVSGAEGVTVVNTQSSILGSPNKMIMGSASPKLIRNKPKAAVSKRKWGEANFVVAGRATKMHASSHRPVMKEGLLAFSSSKNTVAVRPSDMGRLAETCVISMKQELVPHGMTTVEADFYQIGTAGPAAYLPKLISIDRLAPMSDFPKNIKPALRPIFITFPKEGHDDSFRLLREDLSNKSQFAVSKQRSVETAACANNTVTTFRHAQDEVLALFPPGHAAESEVGEHKVSVENYLLCMWVVLPAPSAQGYLSN